MTPTTQDLSQLTAPELESYEERAAIIEHLANEARSVAESLAYEQIIDARKITVDSRAVN